jgi:exosortase B
VNDAPSPTVLGRFGSQVNLAWAIVLGAFLVMFVPSYLRAANGIWQSDEHSHAPIVGVIGLWLIWQRRAALVAAVQTHDAGSMRWSLMLLTPGFLLYWLGRTLSITSVEFLAHWLCIGGLLAAFGGRSALREVLFAWCYLLFMVPLPGVLIDTVTGPHKELISAVVVDGLYSLGYPTARAGVLITAGPYQLLVADACSGLNSMLSLAALGTLYIHLVSRNRSRWHLALLVAAIVPIALVANMVRVAALVLVTLHLGDEAGQGFLHGAAGMVLLLAALLLFILLDMALDKVMGRHKRRLSQSLGRVTV